MNKIETTNDFETREETKNAKRKYDSACKCSIDEHDDLIISSMRKVADAMELLNPKEKAKRDIQKRFENMF